MINPVTAKRGFTLIELLVVISVILIASSIMFMGGNSGGGAKLTSSQRIVSGIAQGARGQAILKNADTRLIIYSELNTGATAEIDKMLRFFGIVYADPDNAGQWIAATQGTYLPEGIYFDPGLSAANGWGSGNTMNLEYPRASSKAETSGPSYYYYAFESNGTSTDVTNPWLVIRAGQLKPTDAAATVYNVDFTGEENSGLKAALIFRRTGTTTLVNDPASIN
jgi:prepilin-type N-terminal cleavage/methylation domain-containing protein